MKKSIIMKLLSMLLMIFMLAFVGCGDDDDDEFKVVSVSTIAAISVANGTTFDSITLPKTVTVGLQNMEDVNDTKTETVNVIWVEGTYMSTVAGVYTVLGTLGVEGDNKNPDNLQASIMITVETPVVAAVISTVSATTTGEIVITFDKALTEVPSDLMIMKDDVTVTPISTVVSTIDTKIINVTVDALVASYEDQSVIYSAKLSTGSAIMSTAVTVAGKTSDDIADYTNLAAAIAGTVTTVTLTGEITVPTGSAVTINKNMTIKGGTITGDVIVTGSAVTLVTFGSETEEIIISNNLTIDAENADIDFYGTVNGDVEIINIKTETFKLKKGNLKKVRIRKVGATLDIEVGTVDDIEIKAAGVRVRVKSGTTVSQIMIDAGIIGSELDIEGTVTALTNNGTDTASTGSMEPATVTGNPTISKNLKLATDAVKALTEVAATALTTDLALDQAEAMLVTAKEKVALVTEVTELVGLNNDIATAEATIVAKRSEYELVVLTTAEVADAKVLIEALDYSALVANVNLPATIGSSVTVAWATSDETVITTMGAIARPVNGLGNAMATLTATLTKGAATGTATVAVTVLEAPAVSSLVDGSFTYDSVIFGTQQKYSYEIIIADTEVEKIEFVSPALYYNDGTEVDGSGNLLNSPKMTTSTNGNPKASGYVSIIDGTTEVMVEIYKAGVVSYTVTLTVETKVVNDPIPAVEPEIKSAVLTYLSDVSLGSVVVSNYSCTIEVTSDTVTKVTVGGAEISVANKIATKTISLPATSTTAMIIALNIDGNAVGESLEVQLVK